MEPTKDDFMVSYIGIHDSRDNEKLKEQIFKWKEDAEQWKIYLSGGLNNLFEIVERLKKELEETQDYLDNYPNYEGSGTVEVKKRIVPILQEILEGYDEYELTPEELKAVKEAEADYKAGRVYTHEEVGKMLGLDEGKK